MAMEIVVTHGGGKKVDATVNGFTIHTDQHKDYGGDGSARVGHHDRQGGGQNPTSWNSAHASRGCSQENLQATGGNGFFFCFATDGNVPQPALHEE